jgi:Domain of unknown function (DUF4302)
MKINSLYISLLFLFITSCNKSEVESLFKETATTRVTNLIESYKTTLTNAQFGWKGAYYPNGAQDGGYSFYLKFDKNGNLTMYSDVDAQFTDKAFETTYQVKALQKPTLIFDSYSYLHELVNPDYNGGEGARADLELEVTSITADKVILEGTRNNTELTLTKLTNAEFESVTKGGLANIFKSTVTYVSSDKFINLKFPNGQNTDVFIDLNTKILTIMYLKDNDIATVSSAFITTITGLQLKKPINLNGISITELIWDNQLKNYYFLSGSTRTNLIESIKPALPFIYGLGTLFADIVLDPQIATQSAEYKKLYSDIKAKTIALSTTAPTRVIGDIYFHYFADDGVFALVIDYTRTYPDRVDTFGGVIIYNPSIDNSGNITFTRQSQTYTLVDGEFFLDMSPIVLAGIKEFTDLIEKNSFTWDYDTVESKTSVLRAVKAPNFTIKGTLY